MANNNKIRSKKFKVGSLYRNDIHPKTLYLCIADCEWLGNEKKYSRKALVVIKDGAFSQGDEDCCEGHIVASTAVKNWNWREV
jgi:hypothetical protein